jgi:hypothetical protein
MRRLLVLLLACSLVTPAAGAPQPQQQASLEGMLSWINQYRLKPEPHRVPEAMRVGGRLGAFKDPESAGVYVGFLAGVLKANPKQAEQIVSKILPLPPDQQWVVVRAIAYSGLPQWKGMLGGFKMHMPGRGPMIDKYLDGKLATLDQVAQLREKPSFWEKIRGKRDDEKKVVLEPTPDLIDTFWGIYFASGSYEPVGRLIELLPLSKDNDDVERLTLGGMAKYTLAQNAARDHELLAKLRWSVRYQDKETVSVLNEVIVAAETVDTGKIRKEAVAAIEELKRKGPGYRRKIAGWGQIGQGAIALGCIGAAVAGAVVLGLPCVIGGAVSSAAINAWSAQE